jgi:hypothetical protein
MDFIDFTWDEIEGTFVKENILGSEFSFSTKTDIQVSIDYIPKIQARKIFTYAKEQLDILKNKTTSNIPIQEEIPVKAIVNEEVIEEMETEEVTNFAEIMPSIPVFSEPKQEIISDIEHNKTNTLSQEELFAKLQNYKKLLDNGLILQGEYDAFKKEILSLM